MNEQIEIALEKFNKENPNADSFELAAHFFNMGRIYEQEHIKTQRELEKKLPCYYGN